MSEGLDSRLGAWAPEGLRAETTELQRIWEIKLLPGLGKNEGLTPKFWKVLRAGIFESLREPSEFPDLPVSPSFTDEVRGWARGGGNCPCGGRNKKKQGGIYPADF